MPGLLLQIKKSQRKLSAVLLLVYVLALGLLTGGHQCLSGPGTDGRHVHEGVGHVLSSYPDDSTTHHSCPACMLQAGVEAHLQMASAFPQPAVDYRRVLPFSVSTFRNLTSVPYSLRGPPLS